MYVSACLVHRSTASRILRSSYYPSFLAELRKLGFEQGRNLLVEYRSFGQDISQATASVNELIAWKADALFVFGPEFPLRAAATAAPIPIVVGAINFDPITKGFMQSLARPGGNITGVSRALAADYGQTSRTAAGGISRPRPTGDAMGHAVRRPVRRSPEPSEGDAIGTSWIEVGKSSLRFRSSISHLSAR